jgi:ABC-type antimicrobial peptide transport system permease subunit
MANSKKNIYLVVSVAVSLLLFLGVAFYLDFNTATKMKSFDKFQNNYILIETQDSDAAVGLEDLFAGKDYFENTYEDGSGEIILNDETLINIQYKALITDKVVCDIYFGLDLGSYSGYEKYHILYGRNNFVAPREIIISEEHAELIANNAEEAVGMKIPVTVGEHREIYEVVGIFEQTLSESRRNKDFSVSKIQSTSELDNYSEVNGYLNFDIFVSELGFEKYDKASIRDYYYYVFYHTDSEYEKLLTSVIMEGGFGSKSIPKWNYVTKDLVSYEKDILEGSDLRTKTLIMLIITIVSGINVFGTLVGAIAERKREIGIKKALGASDGDIMLGFVVENVINAIIATVLAVSVVAILFLIYAYYRRERLFEDYTIILYPTTIILFAIFALSSTFAFSLIPSYRASKTNVVDAIRVE